MGSKDWISSSCCLPRVTDRRTRRWFRIPDVVFPTHIDALYGGGGAGVIDKETMRRFDESCLTPVHEFTAKEIQAVRDREQVSQMVFARYLNVSKESVSQWERGEKHPAGTTLKLLSLVEKKGLAAIA
jgi:putative transcriptional regulator